MINLNSDTDLRIKPVLANAECFLENAKLRQGKDINLELNFQQDSKLDAMVLLSYILSKPKSYLLTWPEALITQGQYAMYQALLQRRAKGEPVAYLIGQKEFFSLLLKVDKNTLIPRPETELLVENILEKFKNHKNNNIKILDLGTGSGAIAIALAKTRPNWFVTAVDESKQALNIAQKNAKLHNLSNIEFIESDWFDNLDENAKYDCIVSNPPYIAQDDPYLQTEIKYEPRGALVSDENGLADIKKIIDTAHNFLNQNGMVFIEHGYNQQDEILTIVKNHQEYSSSEGLKDYAGQPRIVNACKS